MLKKLAGRVMAVCEEKIGRINEFSVQQIVFLLLPDEKKTELYTPEIWGPFSEELHVAMLRREISPLPPDDVTTKVVDVLERELSLYSRELALLAQYEWCRVKDIPVSRVGYEYGWWELQSLGSTKLELLDSVASVIRCILSRHSKYDSSAGSYLSR